jgi:hypothetical protein
MKHGHLGAGDRGLGKRYCYATRTHSGSLDPMRTKTSGEKQYWME